VARGREMRRAATRHRHLNAVGDERARDRETDAARPAGDERDLPAE